MAEKLLSYQRVVSDDGAPPAHWLYVLHGMYGAGRNWGAVARQFVRARPEWGALLLDLRQHGGSQRFPPPHTLAAAAADVAALARQGAPPPAALLGHSFGGKVALLYAREHGAALDQVWIVDSTPEARPPGGDSWEMLARVHALPNRFASRAAGVQALVQTGTAPAVAEWMSTNLEPSGGGYVWRLDFDALEELLRDFSRADLWDVVEQPPGHLQLHFVKASDSDVLSSDAVARIEAAARRTGRVYLQVITGGHWLNADNPGAVVELLAERLGDLE